MCLFSILSCSGLFIFNTFFQYLTEFSLCCIDFLQPGLLQSFCTEKLYSSQKPGSLPYVHITCSFFFNSFCCCTSLSLEYGMACSFVRANCVVSCEWEIVWNTCSKVTYTHTHTHTHTAQNIMTYGSADKYYLLYGVTTDNCMHILSSVTSTWSVCICPMYFDSCLLCTLSPDIFSLPFSATRCCMICDSMASPFLTIALSILWSYMRMHACTLLMIGYYRCTHIRCSRSAVTCRCTCLSFYHYMLLPFLAAMQFLMVLACCWLICAVKKCLVEDGWVTLDWIVSQHDLCSLQPLMMLLYSSSLQKWFFLSHCELLAI